VLTNLSPGRRVTGRISPCPAHDEWTVGCVFAGVFRAGRLSANGTFVIRGVPPEVTSVTLRRKGSPFDHTSAPIDPDETALIELSR
jgi:hypothetical protein